MSDAPSTSATASSSGESAVLVPAAEEKKTMMLILRSEDKVNMEVPSDVAFQSNLLSKMVDNLKIEDSNSPSLKEPLKMQNITAETLKKIIEWCTKHRGEVFRHKEDYEDPRTILTKEDEEWMDVTSEQLLNLLLAANYLDIPGIIDIITQKIANMITGKTVEQIRDIYGLENDFTPVEEEEIRKRFAWVENH